MKIREIERVHVECSGPCSPLQIECSRCRGVALFCDEVVHEHRTSNLSLDFVFAGWKCVDCGENFATDEVTNQISRLTDARLVALGLRLAVNPATVLRMKKQERKRRMNAEPQAKFRA